ncbi:MAG: hypothetical protein COV48_12325 [Elusimicrobia bacterium CG11_big_fil_rev_8_21_14_0_20_64_6]|nr:MAG: hypothetical protein COV48_12325 [Elusimicrobia bacterium CG11_big_fil_rev_8_21_14_0_20_64_6]
MSSEFRFPLTDAKENGQMAVSAKTAPETFPDALSEGALKGPVSLVGMILAVDDEASFTGTAAGRWTFECTRCLKPLELEWTAPIEAMVPIDGGPMDLTDEVRQSIALAQPMKVLCRPDCKGLCAVCKKNRNEVDCGHPEGLAGDGVPGGGFTETRKPRLTPRPHKG